MIAYLRDLRKYMAAEYHGLGLAELLYKRSYFDYLERIKSDGRLVKYYNIGVSHHSLRNSDSLAIAL